MTYKRATLIVPALVLAASPSSAQNTSTQIANAETAFDTLQGWYNPGTGLWDTAGWWNGANSLTVVAELAQVDNNTLESAINIFENTFTVGPSANPDPGTEGTASVDPTDPSSWLDGAYDDDQWWGLAWIAAYDATGNETYLTLAEGIFDSIAKTWGTRCGNGGIYWDTDDSYINAIVNELFLSMAGHLANRVPNNASYYIDWAEKEWNWFLNSSMIGSNNTINDGLTESCTNNGQTIWSYNQGVVLGGLVELNKASPNSSYIEWANKIAQAAIATLADSNYVIHEIGCEPDCAPNGTQFKGIFIRNLLLLNKVSPNDLYSKVIQACATSIWANDRDDSTNQLSIDWAGPYISPANSSTHSSAMDALVAAISL